MKKCVVNDGTRKYIGTILEYPMGFTYVSPPAYYKILELGKQHYEMVHPDRVEKIFD